MLAWNIDLNVQDSQGLTPLHLAIQRVKHTNSIRSVRALLNKGAVAMYRDKAGKSPKDYAEDLEDVSQRSKLKNLFAAYSKGPRKSRKTMLFYYCLIFLMQAIKFTTVYPRQI